MPDFGSRLQRVFDATGRLCLGIDPHAYLLQEWGLSDDAEGTREFGLRCVAAATGIVGIVKPQVAFFERHGAAGFAALEAVLAAARQAGLLVIADGKRGDIGSTVAAYGEAWLRTGAPLEADAMTVSPYQGVGSLSEVISLAREHRKGIFILAATSNLEAAALQTARLHTGERSETTVAAGIVAEVAELNPAAPGLGSVGVVIGATVDVADYGIEPGSLRTTPILAPGFGEQGALLGDARRRYGAAAESMIANVGRAVLRRGPDGIRAELEKQAGELAEGFA